MWHWNFWNLFELSSFIKQEMCSRMACVLWIHMIWTTASHSKQSWLFLLAQTSFDYTSQGQYISAE